LGCKKGDTVTLYIPARRGSVIPNYEDHLIIMEESLVIPHMQRLAEELCANISVSQATKEDELYEGRTSSWFIGGFLVHNYIYNFFVDVLKEYLRMSTSSLKGYREAERCLYFELSEPNYKKRLFLWYDNKTKKRIDKLIKRLIKTSSWEVEKGFYAPDNREYVSFQLKNHERYFFIIKFTNSRGKGVFVCFGADAGTNLKLVRMIREEQEWLYRKIRWHRNGYILFGKADKNREDICLSDIIDLSWLLDDKLSRNGF
jgi:hypothetical protein